MGAYSRGGFEIFLLVGHIPVENILLVECFFDTTPTSNRISFKGLASVR